FRCTSSFDLALVPNQSGVFALAEEITPAGDTNAPRILAVFEVNEADDLAYSMSRQFASSSEWRQKLEECVCFARYAVVTDEDSRLAAASALRQWLDSKRTRASHIFERVDPMPEKTVAERAVDRVMQATAAGL
ncbi:MAG TPA: hypothetical protein VE783_07920, partial [Candidatus Limnocylindrales bacterium]|nr:hypothetical protein [Candidatus Limnocylindrales bacterium]